MDREKINIATRPFRWGHVRVLFVESWGQLTGAVRSTVWGTVQTMVDKHTEAVV